MLILLMNKLLRCIVVYMRHSYFQGIARRGDILFVPDPIPLGISDEELREHIDEVGRILTSMKVKTMIFPWINDRH